MLDRMSLSIKNGWFDEQNRAYIVNSIEREHKTSIQIKKGLGKTEANLKYVFTYQEI